MNRNRSIFGTRTRQCGLVIRARRAGGQALPSHLAAALWSLAHIHCKRNVGALKEPTQSAELVLRESVHRVDDHCYDTRRRVLVTKLQTATDDRIEKGFGLA